MTEPRQLVTPATTATARPRRSCSGRRYRAPFCSGFAATASWKTRASSGGGGSSCGGRDRRRRPNRRRPELGQQRRWRYRAWQGAPVGVSGSQERGEHAGDARASGRAQEHGARRPWRRRASAEVGNGARARTRAGEKGESVHELTVVAERVSVGSGATWRRRIGPAIFDARR